MTDSAKTMTVLAALMAFFAGYLISNYQLGTAAAAHHDPQQDVHAQMHHEMFDISDTDAIPKIDLVVHKDAVSGWNLQLVTENFRFAPEHASTEPILGEGHAHLYIDGTKIARVYGPWFHIAELDPGTHKVRVTLNANSHQDYAVKGEVIEETETVIVTVQ